MHSRGLIGEHACAEAGHKLLDLVLVAVPQNVLVHDNVVAPELDLVLHVLEQA